MKIVIIQIKFVFVIIIISSLLAYYTKAIVLELNIDSLWYTENLFNFFFYQPKLFQ